MTGTRRVRRVLSGLVALAVVAAVVYGAAALLSPVPRLHVEQTATAAVDGAWAESLTLPESGSTTLLAESGSVASGGSVDARPIAGAAKLVLANVVLATEPISTGGTGDAVMIDQPHVDRYRELDAAGARTVAVRFGQSWTRRDLLAATIIGSGNNTAELLVDEVFGGLEGYRAAARRWLDEQGLTSTTVADGTGLDPASRSTAVELAQLGALTLANPLLGELLDARPRTTQGGGAFADEAAFLRDEGTVGMARTYTDAAGVCVLVALPVGDETIVIALLGQPGYPAAEEAMRALIEGVRAGVRPVEVISAGQVVAVARSAWGQSTELIATAGVTVSSTELDGLGVRLEAASRSTIVQGADAGSLVVTAGGVEQIVRVESASAITEPGVAWRFADPITVIERWTR